MKIVLSTAPEASGADLARALVEGSAAACVNILSTVRSFYRWEGEVCDEAEVLLICKTADVAALTKALQKHHPYDTPEIVALDVDDEASDPRYVAWVHELTGSERP